jgi:hypothetical protein
MNKTNYFVEESVEMDLFSNTSSYELPEPNPGRKSGSVSGNKSPDPAGSESATLLFLY